MNQSNKYLFSSYHLSDTVLVIGTTGAKKKALVPALMKLTVQWGTEICLNKNAVVKLPLWQELWWCGHSPVRVSHREIWPVRRSGSFSEKVVLELKSERSEGVLSRGSGEGRTHWAENTAVWFPILALGCCCFAHFKFFWKEWNFTYKQENNWTNKHSLGQ